MNKKALSLAMMVAGAFPATSNALSLGDIESNSNLNQPLRAKIELLATSPQEAQQLNVRLAPNSVFNRVGVDRPAFLNSLRFTSSMQNGKPVILVSSDAPISEPFVNFLLEVSWPNGQLLKEYTVMLDPPVLMQPGSALAGNEAAVRAEPRSSGVVNRPRAAASPTQVASAQQQAAQQQAAQAQQRARQQQQAAQAQQRARQQQARQRAQQQQLAQSRQNAQRPATNTPRTYRVRRGDTLFKVASRLRQPGTNVDQMMMALYRANPKAFIKGNINGLKAGAVLRTPATNSIRSTSRAQARSQVRQHYAEWKKFRSRLAARTVPQKSAVSTRGGANKQTTAANSKTDKARLEVLGKTEKAGNGNSAAGSEQLAKLEKQLALAEESLVTRQRENKELKSRVTDLESMLRKKNRLIALRDDQLAQLQKKLADAGLEADAPAMTGLVNQQQPAANNAQQDVPTRANRGQTAGERDVQNNLANATQAEQNRIARTEQQPDATRNDQRNQEQSKSPFADDQSGDNDLMSLLTSPMAWKIGAGALFSLLLLWLLSRLFGRRKVGAKTSPVVENDPVIFDGEREPHAAVDITDESKHFRELEHELDKAERDPLDDPFGMGTGEQAQTGKTTSEIVEAQAATQTDEDEVLMEANVYIAYGLHQQAESELKKALEKHPGRLEYRHKLLENYFSSNDRNAFDEHAKAYLATSGADRNSKDWKEIAEWGEKISPDNSLYSEKLSGGAKVAAGVAAAGAAVAGVAATADGGDNQVSGINTDLDDSVLDSLQTDESGLDDFDFDLNDLEKGLATVDEPVTHSATADELNDRLEQALEENVPDSHELADTVDDGLDFSLDDLMGELKQEQSGESLGQQTGGLNTSDTDPVVDNINFDDLLSGSPDDGTTNAQDDSDGVSLMGGLAAGAAATAAATAAAVVSGKDKASEALSGMGDAVADTVSDAGQSIDNALDFNTELPELPDVGEVSEALPEAVVEFDAELPDLASVQDEVSAGAEAAVDNVTNLQLHLDNETGLDKILPEDTFYKPGAGEEVQASSEADDGWMGDIDDALSFLDMPDEEIDLHEAHISTKLDLARAYLDMGDVEGARSTLEEVMVEGNDNQRREAETLLHQTG